MTTFIMNNYFKVKLLNNQRNNCIVSNYFKAKILNNRHNNYIMSNYFNANAKAQRKRTVFLWLKKR